MALMLALSMVIGMTGAWFTDTDSKSDNGGGAKTFGTVDVGLGNIAAGTWSNTNYNTDPFLALPGSVYTFNGSALTNSSTADIYALIEITAVSVVFTTAGQTPTSVTKTGVEAGFISELVAPAVATLTEVDHANCPGMYLLQGGADATIDGGHVTIDVELPNAYQGGTVAVSFSLSVKAIQAANHATPAAAYALLQAL